MPKGEHLCKDTRKNVYHYLVTLKKSPEEVHTALFRDDHSLISLRRLYNILYLFRSGDDIRIKGYLNCLTPRKGAAGRHFLLQPPDCQTLRDTICESRSAKLKAIRARFNTLFNDEVGSVPSRSCIYETLCRIHISRKRLSRRNINQDPHQQHEFMDRISFLGAEDLVDMDGIHFNPNDNLARWGWADVGEEAVVLQIVLFNETYAVHAAMGENGFIAWEIFDCNVAKEHVIHFIRHHLLPVFPDNAFLLLDNARNQQNEAVHQAMEQYIGGRYLYASPYSPELKPIERGFSLIRRWIRDNEMHANRNDPTALIQQAFELYSVAGERGFVCYEFFDFYRENHSQYLQENGLL